MSTRLALGATAALAGVALLSRRASRGSAARAPRYDIILVGDRAEDADRELLENRGLGEDEWSHEGDALNLMEDSGVNVHPDEEPWLVAVTKKGELIGAIVAREEGAWSEKIRFSVAVDEDHRRMGVAINMMQALVEYVETVAAARQTSVELQAWVVNPNMGTLLLEHMEFEEDYPGWSPDNPFMRRDIHP